MCHRAPRWWVQFRSTPTAIFELPPCSIEPTEPRVSASTADAPPCSSPYGWVLPSTGMEQMFAGAVQQAVKEAHAAAGHEFNLGSPKQLQEVLFGELALPKTKRTKTGYTTDADALAWLATQTDNELPVIMLRQIGRAHV